MNNFSATGRLSRHGEQRYTQGGAAVLTINLAVDSGYGDRKKTLWIKGVIFGKRAEGQLVQYLIKGTQIAVTGELSMDEWQDKDGQKRQSLALNIATLDLIGGKRDGDSGGGSTSGPGDGYEPPPMGDDSVPF